MYAGILFGLSTAMFLCMLVFKFTLCYLFNRPYKYLDTPITDMVYGYCMAKSSAFLKQMSTESSSSLSIDYGLSFFFTVNIVRCSGVLRKKKENSFLNLAWYTSPLSKGLDDPRFLSKGLDLPLIVYSPPSMCDLLS